MNNSSIVKEDFTVSTSENSFTLNRICLCDFVIA